MDSSTAEGDAINAQTTESRKSHVRDAESQEEVPNKVLKLQEGDDALTNQNKEEEALVSDLTNDVGSDIDLADDVEYGDEDDSVDRPEEEAEVEQDEEEQLDLDGDDAAESDQAGELEEEEDFEYEDELGTTAEENDDNNDEDEAYSSTELQDFVQANLAYIEDCQSDIDSLNHKANEEILRVEQKYNKLRQPVYKRRSTYIERVPHFWANVFSQHSQLRQVLTKEDIKCLKNVTRLQVEDFEDNRSGYSIQFYFSENSWFENEVITKEYHLPWHGSPSCTCTPIKWKKGMNLTMKSSSFFSWFTSQADASADDIAEIIKDELWPNPLQSFLINNKHPDDSDEEDADDSGTAAKDDSIVLLDDTHDDDDVEYISSDDAAEWENKENTEESSHYLIADDDDEDNQEEEEDYEDFDDEIAGEEEDVQNKKNERSEGVITVDDDYLESDDDEYFDETVDLEGEEKLMEGKANEDQEVSEEEEEPELGETEVQEEAKEEAVNQGSHDDSRQSNGVVESSTHEDDDELDVTGVSSKSVTSSVDNELMTMLPTTTKLQEQSKVVSTSTTDGDPDTIAGAT